MARPRSVADRRWAAVPSFSSPFRARSPRPAPPITCPATSLRPTSAGEGGRHGRLCRGQRRVVLNAWGDSVGAGDKVVMLGDGNGEFAAAAGLELDGRAFGLGTRSQRYAAILKDGVVRRLMVEPDPLAVTVSSVDTMLAAL